MYALCMCVCVCRYVCVNVYLYADVELGSISWKLKFIDYERNTNTYMLMRAYLSFRITGHLQPLKIFFGGNHTLPEQQIASNKTERTFETKCTADARCETRADMSCLVMFRVPAVGVSLSWEP